jgi:hypothetical protein
MASVKNRNSADTAGRCRAGKRARYPLIDECPSESLTSIGAINSFYNIIKTGPELLVIKLHVHLPNVNKRISSLYKCLN